MVRRHIKGWCHGIASLLRSHNPWVQSYRHVVDEIVRKTPGVPQAHAGFGPILGNAPVTSEVAACLFPKNTTSLLFREVHTFPRGSDSGTPRFMPLWSAT